MSTLTLPVIRCDVSGDSVCEDMCSYQYDKVQKEIGKPFCYVNLDVV